MRVLLLNYEYPPNGGGAGVATDMLARSLAAGGATVDVVTAGASDSTTMLRYHEEGAGLEGVLTIRRVRCRRTAVHQAGMGDAASYLVAAHPVARDLLRRHHYDVAHFFFSLPTGALLPLLPLDDVPVVVSLRGSDVPGYDPHNRAIRHAHALLRPLTRFIWGRADRVVAVCDSLGVLARRTMPALEYAVVPNGVDLELFRPARDREYRTDRILCLAVSRLVERKGLRDLVHALALLERGRFGLEIVGAGPDEGALRDLTTALSLGHDVRFLGALDREQTAARYRAADLFTLPSAAEAFGNVFAEALASGLPVVGTAVGGIPELVEHDRNGLLVGPRDPGALAGAIRLLADDPRRRQAMALRNRAKAEATLDWSDITARYRDIYRDIMRGSVVEASASLPLSTAPLADVPSRGWQ